MKSPLRLVLAVTFLALSLPPAAIAAVPEGFTAEGSRIRWLNSVATENDDWINDIAPLRSGGFLGVGFLNRKDGSPPSDWRGLAWEFTADGGAGRQLEYGAGGGVDALWRGLELADGRRVFGGFTTRMGAGGIDAWLLVTNAEGVVQHDRAFGGPAYDRITDLAVTRDGGFIGVGHMVDPASQQRQVFVIVTGPDGAERGRHVYRQGESSGALYVEPTPDGNFILTGGTTPSGEDADLLVIKLDQTGAELWRKVVGEPVTRDVNHGVVVRPDGRIVVVGYTQSWGAADYDFVAVTLSAHGEVLHREVFGGEGDDRTLIAAVDAAGKVWLAGQAASGAKGANDVLVAGLDNQGRLDRLATFGGAGSDHGTAVVGLQGGDLLIGGYSTSLSGGAQDAFVMRVERPGAASADKRFKVR